MMGKCIISEADIVEAAQKGTKTLFAAPAECIVTASARDKAAELGIVLREGPEPTAGVPAALPSAGSSQSEQLVRAVCTRMKDRLPAGVADSELERLVRAAVATRLAGAGPAAASDTPEHFTCADGVCFISGTRLLAGGSGPVPVAEKVLVAEAIRCGDDLKLAGGFMEWQKASFNRTVEFPEIAVVIEGELHLEAGGKTLVVKAGDMVYLPKGAQVAYSAPGRVRVACINCIR